MRIIEREDTYELLDLDESQLIGIRDKGETSIEIFKDDAEDLLLVMLRDHLKSLEEDLPESEECDPEDFVQEMQEAIVAIRTYLNFNWATGTTDEQETRNRNGDR